ncbi:hypothetical protein CR513_13088, partial [Mucuna pruriens]
MIPRIRGASMSRLTRSKTEIALLQVIENDNFFLDMSHSTRNMRSRRLALSTDPDQKNRSSQIGEVFWALYWTLCSITSDLKIVESNL